jgi:thioesterase domain-containing protein
LREMKKMSLRERLVRYKRSAGKRILTATGTKGVRTDWREQYWPENFTPPRFRAPIVLFKRPKQQFYYVNDPEMGWGKRSLGGVEIHQIEFHHSQILREPHVRQFGETLATWMTRLSLQIRQPQDATDMQGAFATSTHRL